jgi:hypothetical protein
MRNQYMATSTAYAPRRKLICERFCSENQMPMAAMTDVPRKT